MIEENNRFNIERTGKAGDAIASVVKQLN